ncbi:urokinase plasminogen activator surface receptor-like [Rhinatrema bivittatum]|uniref:urokinase plasminogen activator surface receptor-like n=1 Tax=Rhinatrema bivittatum TaxID=194408 RepID=UPI001125F81A|nr:urokinase plasminogen activator surface receptor-like [Rhinatrema bivittatum]
MKRLIQILLAATLLCSASSIQCYQYQGESIPPQQQNVITCKPNVAFCTSTLIRFNGMLNGETLVKGCLSENENICNMTITEDKNVMHVYKSVQCCDMDLCNLDLLPDVSTKDHEIQCFVCNGNPAGCSGDQLPTTWCGEQTRCMEISIGGALTGDGRTRFMMKGCGNAASCGGFAAFSDGHQPLSYYAAMTCCNGSACNTGTFVESEPGKENGLEVTSCAKAEKGGLSLGHMKRTKCTGTMTQCLDIIGEAPNQSS